MSSDDREVETETRERAGRCEGEPGDEHCALNWVDVDESTLLSEAGMTGGEHCAPGAGTIVMMQ